jgi:hypothetical protein
VGLMPVGSVFLGPSSSGLTTSPLLLFLILLQEWQQILEMGIPPAVAPLAH